jgi:hypothetical protein
MGRNNLGCGALSATICPKGADGLETVPVPAIHRHSPVSAPANVLTNLITCAAPLCVPDRQVFKGTEIEHRALGKVEAAIVNSSEREHLICNADHGVPVEVALGKALKGT